MRTFKTKKTKILNLKKNLFLVVVAGLKRKKKKFGFQSPRSPSSPSSLGFAGEATKEEGFFGLVPLVTHPSSIPLLGCLIPKFLSLSLHSL
jgi:hypothetical protein